MNGAVLVSSAGVACGWCGNHDRGCAACCEARRFWHSLAVASHQLLAAIEADDEPERGLFADHLEEIGHSGAARYRGEWMP